MLCACVCMCVCVCLCVCLAVCLSLCLSVTCVLFCVYVCVHMYICERKRILTTNVCTTADGRQSAGETQVLCSGDPGVCGDLQYAQRSG